MLRLAFVVVFVIDETIQYQQLGRVVGATIVQERASFKCHYYVLLKRP